jgi:hypothetical protein
MNTARLAPGLAFALALLGGCTTQRVENKEDLLSAAGFRAKLATTPQQLASMQRLPPHKFVHQVRDGRDVWLYADPTVCRCIYAGTDQAWQTYRAEVFQKRVADEQAMTAQMNMDAMEWGPWGPGPWWY